MDLKKSKCCISVEPDAPGWSPTVDYDEIPAESLFKHFEFSQLSILWMQNLCDGWLVGSAIASLQPAFSDEGLVRNTESGLTCFGIGLVLQVQAWARQHQQRLSAALSELQTTQELVENLLGWLQWAETTLNTKDKEPMPQELEEVKGLIAEHQVQWGGSQLVVPPQRRPQREPHQSVLIVGVVEAAEQAGCSSSHILYWSWFWGLWYMPTVVLHTSYTGADSGESDRCRV